jgi:sodium transport system permease protein
MIVLFKETIDNARDRRSLLIALFYPLMGPILLGLMIAAVDRATLSGSPENMTLSIAGAEHAPMLISWLEEQDVDVREAPQDVHGAVKNGDIEVAIIIDPDFSTHFLNEKTALIAIVVNSSTLSGLVNVNQVASLLGVFNNSVWGERIAARGIEYRALQPVAFETESVTSGSHISDIFLLMVPPLFIFNLFMGGAYLAIDTTSGERERGSLEPLLINPIKRSSLVAGKFLAALFYTFIAVAVQMLAFKAAFYFGGGEDVTFDFSISVLAVFGILIITLPLMMAAVAVQFIIATITRSFKEAQTYLGLLPLVPALPAMLLVFAPLKIQMWMMTIPILSQTLLIGQVLRQDPVSLINVVVSMVTTLAVAGVLVAITIRLYEREELIFGS